MRRVAAPKVRSRVPSTSDWVSASSCWVVFFVLPALVSTDPTGTNPDGHAGAAASTEVAASTAGTLPKAATQGTEGRSPFADAQESALRRDAQEVLQALLSLQESLDERGATR